MDEVRYVALLRGINVGGNRIIKMERLRTLFEEMGFHGVKTYIQSGNVIFDDSEKNKLKLIEQIEGKLFEEIKSKINVVVLSFAEVKEIMDEKPEGFGEHNADYKYDVLFLIAPLTAKVAIKEFNPREGVDKIDEGKNVLYHSILKKERTKSRISKIIDSIIYPNLTIRNWNTTSKLVELMSDEK